METAILWKSFTGTLDEWDAKQGNMYTIETPKIILNGEEISCPRIALDEAGTVAAIEVEGPSSTVCVVLIR